MLARAGDRDVRETALLFDLPIRERDGQMICGPCWRKATAQVTHVVEAPAPVKAVPKPPAKVAAPVASGAVWERPAHAAAVSDSALLISFLRA